MFFSTLLFRKSCSISEKISPPFFFFHKNKTRTFLRLYINLLNHIYLVNRMTFVCLTCWPGSADPDGGVDAPAPPADPAAHLRLPDGAARWGRAQHKGRRPSNPCRRPQPEHPQRSQLWFPEYVPFQPLFSWTFNPLCLILKEHFCFLCSASSDDMTLTSPSMDNSSAELLPGGDSPLNKRITETLLASLSEHERQVILSIPAAQNPEDLRMFAR